jgi:hypothetical protein
VILQNMTGGRSGISGTFLLVALFAYRQGGWRSLLLSIVWLCVISWLVAHYYTLASSNNLYILRNTQIGSFSQAGELLAWLDRLSSYRISILITAFSGLDTRGFLLGIGLGNFVGYAPTYPELGIVEVHNVFLKIFGEYGVFGFLIFTLTTLIPIARRNIVGIKGIALYLQLIYFLVAMVHPDLMMTAINVSFVYFSCYAFLMQSNDGKSVLPTAIAKRSASGTFSRLRA